MQVGMEGGSHLESFSGGGEPVEGVMRNGQIQIPPGHLRVEMVTTTEGCDATGGWQQADT